MAFSIPGLLLACALILQFSSALPSLPNAFDKRIKASPLAPIPPSKDPFYTAPPNFESVLPGKILRVRVAPGNITSIIANSSAAYNIVYRTTNSRYRPSWAVTTLFIPIATTEKLSSESTCVGKALLSYQFPYDTADVDASPSFDFYTYPQGSWIDISTALGQGWYVSVPDYEGPTVSFTAGVQSGHATPSPVDSVRAVLSSDFGIGFQARYALWGYSGGSLASEWAAELQVHYAPELNFAGAALGGLVPNVSSVIASVNGNPYAGLIPRSLLGITNQYPEAYKYIVDHLNPSGLYNKSTFLSSIYLTTPAADDFFDSQDIWKYFINKTAILDAPIIQKIYDIEGLMGYHGVPQMPIFIYKAIGDEVAPIEYADDLVARYCAVGANILYQRNTIGGHLAEDYNGDTRAFAWLSSVFDGTYSTKYPSRVCTIQNVTVGMDTSPI
ncbi:Core trichothecene cluster (CTC) 8 [Hyphodiscus hymeniophilus]|uniref:Core trichothecene cluster (CTC) 8 n=1 Tax=Hyphodiscus hymeniophilus TaxID=353542 RepID=A0A9P6SQ91_9HELO|nr:Core trichothecene cluster (CTC) 8 [Hyphodiscus hymeniophilus]